MCDVCYVCMPRAQVYVCVCMGVCMGVCICVGGGGSVVWAFQLFNACILVIAYNSCRIATKQRDMAVWQTLNPSTDPPQPHALPQPAQKAQSPPQADLRGADVSGHGMRLARHPWSARVKVPIEYVGGIHTGKRYNNFWTAS